MFTKSNAMFSSVSSLSSLASFAVAALFALGTVTGCAAESVENGGEAHTQKQEQTAQTEQTEQKLEQPVVAPVMIDQDSNGKSVDVAAGQAIMLRLPSNATTGYEWVVSSEGVPFGEPLVSYQAEGAAFGAGGSTTFTWVDTKSVSAGSYPVSLSYKRSWEPGTADTFSFVVEIR
jgi:predicted secreted protein